MMAMINGEVPLYLLNAMFALAAPLSSDPYLQPPIDPETGELVPRVKLGLKFSQAGTYELTGQTGTRANVDVRRFPGQELELAQALTCLSMSDAYNRRPYMPTSTYLPQAMSILMPLGVSQWGIDFDPPPKLSSSRPSSPSEDVRARWIRRECHRRTLWVLQWITITATAMAMQPKNFNEMNITMPLPVNEGIFEYSITSPLVPGSQPQFVAMNSSSH